MLNQKRKGEPGRTAVKPRDTGNVINLMDALRKSFTTGGKAPPSSQKTKKSKRKC
jgi:non-homologous end joining protein Ku